MFAIRSCRPVRSLTFVASALALFVAGSVHAVTLDVLVGGGIAAPMKELAAQFERSTGHHVVLHAGTTPELIRMATSDEAFDAGVVPREVFESPDATARFVNGAPVDVARVGFGVAVKKGAGKPDVSTVDAFKRTLSSAKAIAVVPKSAAGAQVTRIFERLGIADAVAPRLVALPGTNELVEALESRKADLGVFLISVLTAPGLDLAGPLPREVQVEFVFTSAIAKNTAHDDVARSFLDYLHSPAAAAILKAKGMTPA
jgi:molybdate transport system substrate-binding protein